METLKQKLTSRKFLMSLGAVLVAIGGYLTGATSFEAMLAGVVGAVGLYTVGEGIADSGHRA